MADAAAQFLLENLKQVLLNYKTDVNSAQREQIARLNDDLRLFKAFLSDSTKKRRQGDSLRVFFRQIRDVVYEAEDIIDAYITQVVANRSKPFVVRAYQAPVNLRDIARQVYSISRKVKEIYGDMSRFNRVDLNSGGDRDPDQPQVTLVREENVVGFEDEAEKIIGFLKEDKGQLDVISIVGMPGLGKTTLAGKIFRNERVQDEFSTRIWVHISQQFSGKDVYLSILRKFTAITYDMQQKSDNDLAEVVFAHLQRVKFLIVLDGVWTRDDWDSIKVALPQANNTGKVLITSRHIEVARHANVYREPHNLRFLNQDESWLLLRYEVFGKRECPSELEVPGKQIVEHCDGLPLAIVVIGSILVVKFSTIDNMNVKKDAWTIMSENVNMYLLEEDYEQRMERIIALSYDQLPNDMRVCFLYLGMFPQGFEIPASKLIRMWVAEGFIQPRENISPEEMAENYLVELINRNLVRVGKRKLDGRVKTCCIHEMLRNFCLNEARSERENFLEEIKRTPEGFDHPIDEVQKCRRICIHSNILPFIHLRPFGPKVRSFVCFSKEEITVPAEVASSIPSAFKVLRVLDVKPLKFSVIPFNLYRLVHLRYVTLSFNLDVLPSAFARLLNLQTLMVNTSHCTLEIRADIWKLNCLRHLKTNVSATLPKAGKSGNELKNLQTLGTISPESCTEEVFDKCCNLKKLGIRGNLAILLNSRVVSFDRLSKLNNLEKLKLLNDVHPLPSSEGDVHPLPSSEGSLPHLPPLSQFPPRLRSLTLCNTFLDWTHMDILGSLENLKVLKLKDNAFFGQSWVTTDGGFRCLEFLHIGRTNLIEWKASRHHYPSLRCLQLHNCEELTEIPIGLADISSFRVLDLYHSNHAVISAKKILDAKQRKNVNCGEFKPVESCDFKLSVFPHY